MRVCVCFLAGGPGQPQAETVTFLNAVRRVCVLSKNDWYRVYLIRKIRSQHGAEFVQMLLGADELQWVFPEEVLQQVDPGPVGQTYRHLLCNLWFLD